MEHALGIACQPTDTMSVYDFEDIVGGAIEASFFEFWSSSAGAGEETVVDGDCVGVGFALTGVVDCEGGGGRVIEGDFVWV